ncbi:tetratricopeptide repeat protein [Roseivivax sp. GX 12232]|uniref:tetratricopeptide repeat protein n=1 Tax=Roseivivax sp. GX 12232 TaxID=2900547 RepID=UPI001E3869FA|nr:tetratricopeptide repeat protein [Roseivivax sp. GX 12232]MCE0504858.1 tetratricopeptide repeat protein [Roseivivax sp. GX 12232]
MSNTDTDSFINEVTEEVRRDRLYGYLRRYGWIAVLVVLLIVGGAAWREYQAATARAEAQSFGSAILAALEAEELADRRAALSEITPPNDSAAAMLRLIEAGQSAEAGESDAAVAALEQVATNGEVAEIYRNIASFKALTEGAATMAPEERRQGFEALSQPGNPLRLLASEQLALIEIETGNREAALERLTAILSDSEVTQGLRQRASQLIVALGGELQTG